MCIIAIKPACAKRPTDEQLNSMCANNPDGFGFMTWTKDEGLIVKKTMKKKTYLKWVRNIPDEQPVVYHMRIATHGSVQEKNCHPFISADKKWAFAHNGVLSIQNEPDMTDSETFFRRLAIPLLSRGLKPNDNGDFDAMVSTIIGSSKFVFMDKNGKIYSYGQFIHDGELYFSNPSYQPRDYSSYIIPNYCFSKNSSKVSEDDEVWDKIDNMRDMLYELMMYDTYFFDRTKEQIWKEDYEKEISWDAFEIAYDEAEEAMWEDINNYYYDQDRENK